MPKIGKDENNRIEAGTGRPAKTKILKVLAENRFLTTRQIWDKTGDALAGKSLEQIRVELNRLAKASLIKGELIEFEKGRASQYHWRLLQAGANCIGFTRFGRNQRRRPGHNQVEYQRLELETEEQIGLAAGEWLLLKPAAYSGHQPLPARTPQYHVLCQTLTWREFRETGLLPPDVYYNSQALMVPGQANHHLAYLPDNRKAVVFILAKPRTTERFWQARSKQYARIALKLPVYAVFPNSAQAQTKKAHNQLLTRLGLRGIEVGQIADILSEFYEQPY